MKISAVVPIYNEQKNIALLDKELKAALKKVTKKYEVIYVDDGSTDRTFNELCKLRNATIIRFRKNFGQSAAMDAGFRQGQGKLIVSLDGDLQNDPADIPKIIEHLKRKDLDVVCGWRYKRKDPFAKKIFSRLANSFRQILIRDPVHDSGCSLRVYKRECFDDLILMGEMHRYIPSLLRWKGFRIGEVKVRHRKRKYGKTKYGAGRLLKGFLDLFTVWFWRKFSGRPVHIFGGAGIGLTILGGFAGLFSIYLKLFKGASLSDTFLPVVAVFCVILGVQFFVSGILADISIKNYYKSTDSKVYNIREIVRR
ncbi:MAG: glycosyltransferase family 2 protein [Nanoarchaeota archaeon]